MIFDKIIEFSFAYFAYRISINTFAKTFNIKPFFGADRHISDDRIRIGPDASAINALCMQFT